MPDKQGDNRHKNGQFTKGVSGNPDGRPPKIRCIPDILNKIGGELIAELEGVTKLEAIMRMVYRKAFEGENWAVRFIAEYTEGKPVTPISMENNQPIEILRITNEA